MAFNLELHLEETLARLELLNPNAKFLVAYSGGKDSTALLEGLYQLKQKKFPKWEITAGYYWHAWRDTEKDIEVLHKTCQPKNIPWVVLTPNLNIAKTETAAREERYLQLAQLAANLQASAILTAHHLDDDIETLVFRLFRGTGINGLQGIPETREVLSPTGHQVLVARPLLDVPANELMRYVKIQKQIFVDDPTNKDLKHKRNAIRQEIIPAIEKHFPQFRHAFSLLLEDIEIQKELAHLAIEDYWQRLYHPQTDSLDYASLLQLSPELRNTVLRKFLQTHEIECNFARLKSINVFLDGSQRHQLHSCLFSLNAEKFLTIYRNQLSIQKEHKLQIEAVEFTIPAAIEVPAMGMTLSVYEIPIEDRPRNLNFKKLPPYEAYLDLRQYKDKTLTLRLRQAGDLITPLGMSEPVKLKRLLNNRGISRLKRDSIPLITCGNTVLWAVGVEINELVKTKNTPTHYLIFEPIGQETKRRFQRHAPVAALGLSEEELAETGNAESEEETSPFAPNKGPLLLDDEAGPTEFDSEQDGQDLDHEDSEEEMDLLESED